MNKTIVLASALLLASVATAASLASGPSASSPVQVAAAAPEEGADIRISLFGQPFFGERGPLLADGVTLVPLRGIAEKLGAEVSWDEGARSVKLRKESSEIVLTLDSHDVLKNGQPLRLETVPRLVGDITMVPLRVIGESFDTIVTWDEATRTVAIDHLQSLPAVGSYDNYKTLLEKAGQSRSGIAVSAGSMPASEGPMPVFVTDQLAKTAAPAAGAESPRAPAVSATKEKSEAAAADYSKTNTQVEGVDEADVVKTDGTYLYQVNKDRIVIAKAVPAGQMSVTSTVTFGGVFRPNELYIDDNKLVVVGSTSRSVTAEPVPMNDSAPASPAVSQKMIAPIRPVSSAVKAIVYDITDKTTPKQIREVELDGNYVTSRKIGSALYLVTNKYAGYAYMTKKVAGSEQTDEASSSVPFYRDSAVSAESKSVDFPDIRYFPESPESNYMLVGGINLDRADLPMDVAAYLGSGQNVFASGQNLYVAVGKTKALPAAGAAEPSGSETAKRKIAPPSYETNTTVYKFRLEQGKTKFVTQGEVPGTVLNQFSMDEHNGIFRIATTTGEIWRTDENTSKNNMYTLDEAMKPLGKLEGIAPGERTYSVRFMGNRAYMVTFKNTDPLFAIDLTNPSAPAVLGALKIPGYSDYLHPYDETHLIGFGKETAEIPLKGDASDPNRTVAYYQGMKLSLFDVTDVSKPVEMFKEVIGDRGTESELLHNHKALLFSKENNLLAFPVTVMEIPNKTAGADSVTAYGQFKFQGAYVYRLDLTNGFQLKAPITHLTEQELLKAGSSPYGSDRNVERVLYIGDTLYTLSKGLIKANDMTTMQEKGSLPIR